jgi:CDP-diacylglycerol---glycerol-3-phosphate 3-phosphatidyltransferase
MVHLAPESELSWPHVLSFSRVVASPVIAALILAQPGDTYLAAAIIFALASLTDLADGQLARHTRSVSPLGIFLDTTADKVMVSLTLIAMPVAGLAPAWIPMVIIGRELFISGLRSYAATCNRIISAHIWGKGKAALTMVAIPCVLVAASGRAGGVLSHMSNHNTWTALYTLSSWLLVVAAVLTIVSGLRYVVDAAPLFRTDEIAETEGELRPRKIAGVDR